MRAPDKRKAPIRLPKSDIAQARQRGAGEFADALDEVGRHVGLVARGVGRSQHQQAEGRISGVLPQREQHQRGRRVGFVQPLHRLEARVDPAVRYRERTGEQPHVLAGALRERLVGVDLGQVPQPERGLRHAELGPDLADQHRRQ